MYGQVILRFLLAAQHFAFQIAAAEEDEGICTGTYCKKNINNIAIEYASFVRVDGMAFNRTALKEVRVAGTKREREIECADACFAEEVVDCKSAHLEAYEESGADSVCSLFWEDVYDLYPDERKYDREEREGYVSFHLKNTFCEKELCLNNAYCEADFTHDNGTCICTGYSGKYCEKYDVLHYDDVLHYTFDDGKLENVGLGKDYWGDGILNSGKIMRFPARRTKGLACYKGKGTCMEPIPFEKASDCLKFFDPLESFCPSGVTLGFWIRILWSASYDSSGYHYVNIIKHLPGLLLYRHGGGSLLVGANFQKAVYRATLTADFVPLHRNWNFVAITWNPEGMKFLAVLNDNSPVEIPKTQDLTYSAPLSYFRISEGNDNFLMDDFFYFERASTNEDLKQLYEATKEKA